MFRVVLILFVCCNLPSYAAGPEAIYGENGMVVSRSTLASQAGVEILKAGGNAIDAAVATGFALAVAYPSAGNLGGGGFAVVFLKDGNVVTLDHRERAPASAHKNMFLDNDGNVIKGVSRQTHKASGVPGSVDGLLTLLDKYGSLSRKQVMAPAIRLATNGFPLSHDLQRQFKRVWPAMQKYPASIKKFSKQGKPYSKGDLWKQADLAKTLKLIAELGRDGFYKGTVARLIVKEMQRGNGEITLNDLANYKSIWREPVKGNYRGYDVWGMQPPSSGGALIVQMLNMLEPYDTKTMGWGSAKLMHLMIEAERRAYADRTEHMGDPDYFKVPMDMLTSKAYARTRFKDFDANKATDSEAIGAGSWPEESQETTHFSVVDSDGNAVAFTTTLNSGYGNKIVAAGTGVLLNNEMDDFSIKENTANQFGLMGRRANEIEAGKRMLSSMSPTIISKDGKPYLITGSPGGSTIITTTLQIIINVLDHGMGIDAAVSAPRFHHQWKPDLVYYEANGISPDTLDLLKKMGHREFRVSRYGRGIGDANTILIKDGVLHGMKDPRTEGGAVGY